MARFVLARCLESLEVVNLWDGENGSVLPGQEKNIS